MKENLPIGDAWGEDATPEENERVVREIEEWLQEAREAKRRHKILDRFAYAMIWGYVVGVVCLIVVSTFWYPALLVGVWVLGGSFVLNIGLVVAQVVVHRRRRASIIPTTGQEHVLTTQPKCITIRLKASCPSGTGSRSEIRGKLAWKMHRHTS